MEPEEIKKMIRSNNANLRGQICEKTKQNQGARVLLVSNKNNTDPNRETKMPPAIPLNSNQPGENFQSIKSSRAFPAITIKEKKTN